MNVVKVIYHSGSNGLIPISRGTGQPKKLLKDMSSEEITKTCFGMFR